MLDPIIRDRNDFSKYTLSFDVTLNACFISAQFLPCGMHMCMCDGVSMFDIFNFSYTS